MSGEIWDQRVWELSRHGWQEGPHPFEELSFFIYFFLPPLQAVPLAAASDGVDEGGHRPRRASQESAGGQR